jgi:hypothetical protein
MNVRRFIRYLLFPFQSPASEFFGHVSSNVQSLDTLSRYVELVGNEGAQRGTVMPEDIVDAALAGPDKGEFGGERT